MSIEEMAQFFVLPPTSPSPGGDYVWDYRHQEWRKVKDEDDMEWWLEGVIFLKEDTNLSKSRKFNGKDWKHWVGYKDPTLKEFLDQ